MACRRFVGRPQFRAAGKQLYYLRLLTSDRGTLLAAIVEAGGQGGLRTGTPQRLFDIRAQVTVIERNILVYSPHPDGQRFLVNALTEEGEPTINVITNWRRTVSDRTVP